MIRKLNVDFSQTDSRGTICQILSIPNSQVNYLFTKKETKRGGHYHKKNKEYFFIINGKVRISAYPAEHPEEKEEFIFALGDLFMVEPFTMHSFDFLDDTQMIVIYDLGIESGSEKDIYTE